MKKVRVREKFHSKDSQCGVLCDREELKLAKAMPGKLSKKYMKHVLFLRDKIFLYF